MSAEGPQKRYSPEEIAAFEKTRIQNQDEAHEEANMVRSKAQESWAVSTSIDGKPTARDYEDALEMLEELQETAKDESSFDKTLAKIRMGGERAAKILDLAFLNIADMTGPSDGFTIGRRERLVAGVKGFAEGYKEDVQRRENRIVSARKILEEWKVEAEEFAKKETGTEGV